MKIKCHPHHIDCIIRMLKVYWWTFVNKINAWYWRVSIGPCSKFLGKTYFNTMPDSLVLIGSGCFFNSSSTSNLIGVYSPCMISTLVPYANINIGNNCGFSGTVIAAANSITIGNNVRCGSNTLIMDTDWHSGDARAGDDAPVEIEDNVWLGYGVKIMKGVRIGENSLIGACSVVTHNIPKNCVAAGNPCRVIRYLDDSVYK